MNRRRFLAASSTVTTVVIAGCGTPSEEDGEGEDGGEGEGGGNEDGEDEGEDAYHLDEQKRLGAPGGS